MAATCRLSVWCLLVLAALIGTSVAQRRTRVGTSIAGSEIEAAADFECPEEFGYYPAPGDCTRYYVCVFGGALLESCTGGLVYSHELQTCDWPRNVDCLTGASLANGAVTSSAKPSSKAPSTGKTSTSLAASQFLSSEKSSSSSSKTTAGRAKSTGLSSLSFELLDNDDSHSLPLPDPRQGRDFQGASQRTQGPNPAQAGSGGTFRNTVAADIISPRPNSRPRPEELPDDFIPATTFNPANSRFNQANRPAIDTTVRTTPIVPAVEATPFFRETTGQAPATQQTATSSTSAIDFEQWRVQQPARQQPTTAPRAPTRSQQQQTVRQQVTNPPVIPDYDDSLTEAIEDSSAQRPVDEFVDYEFETVPVSRPPTRQQQQQQDDEFFDTTPFIAKSRTTSAATTTTTTTTTTTSKPPTRVSSKTKSNSERGSSRFRDSTAQAEDDGQSRESAQPTSSKRRPTLKPVSDLVPANSKTAEPIDIFKHPPRRLEPIFPQPTPDEPAAKCNAEVCRLPDCFCGGKDIPGGIKVKDVPQLVLLTFDDSVNDLNKDLYKDLFETGRTNPNGCPISATFYVSHEWTDYGQVQNLYADGHEIASHTISHSFGEQFSAKKWAREAAGQRDIMAAYGGVRLEDIRGLRAPFLSVGGNRMFKMLYDMNFTYDSSMPVYENKPPSWPYTLDYKIFHDCMIPPCPTKSYPGVWEVPMVMWQDLNGGRCSMGDGCSNPPDAEGVYKMLIKNFERHYTTNRSPFPLYYHAAWFTTPHHKEGFEAFLDTIVSMEDVWLVTNWQALQWVRDPTPLDRVKSFKPFQCDYPERPKRCNSSKVCNSWHKSGVRYMRTCQPCPEVFPWTGKTGVKNTFLDHYGENEAS